MGSGQPLHVAAHSRKSTFEIGEIRELGFQLCHPPEGLFQCLRQLDLLGRHLLRPGPGHVDPECHVSQPIAAFLDPPDLVLQPSNLLLQLGHHPRRAGQLCNIVPRIGHLRHDLAQARQTVIEIFGTLQRARQRARGPIVGPRQIFRPFLQRFNARKHLADRGIVLEIGELPADILDGRPGLFEWCCDFLQTLRCGRRFVHQPAQRLFLTPSPLDELAEFFGERFDLTATKERLEHRCHGSSPNRDRDKLSPDRRKANTAASPEVHWRRRPPVSTFLT